LKHVPKGELRPIKTIETAEKWANGKATIEQVRKAAAAAYAATGAAAAAAAYAGAGADAAAYAGAGAAAATGARSGTLKICADIVRRHYPNPPKV